MIENNETLGGGGSGSSSGGGGVIVNETYDESTGITTLDKTWQEIFNACISGGCIIHKTTILPTGTINNYYVTENLMNGPTIDGGSVYQLFTSDKTYTCTSPNDYPSNDDDVPDNGDEVDPIS